MTTYYKAIRPDGTSFHDPTFEGDSLTAIEEDPNA